MNTFRYGIGELIAAIPALLETEPREAVVALSLNDSGLPTCALLVPRHVLLDDISSAVTAAAVAEELAAEHGHTVLLVSYTDTDISRGCPALEAVRLEVEFLAPTVEVAGVTGTTWYRPGCTEQGCCPRDLPPAPEPLIEVLAAARGRAAAARAPITVPPAKLLARADAATAWGLALSQGSVADARTARDLAASLDDLCVRDWVVLTILGADHEATRDALAGHESGAVAMALDEALGGFMVPDPSAADRARVVVERVARAARGRRRRAATQTLLGLLDWWAGNLDGARERCDLALEHDDRYRLAELVGLASRRGIAPGWVRAGQNAQ